MVVHENENKQIYQFQVGFMLNHILKFNEAFKEQVEIDVALNFNSKTIMPVIVVVSKYNSGVISLLIFYENRKNMILKVLISVVYCIM